MDSVGIVFCSSGAVSGIRGKQMTPDVASERSIFCKNHDWNSYNYRVFRVAMNNQRTYNSGCRCTRWQKTIYEQTHTHTRDSHSDDNNKDYSKRCSSIGIIQRTVYTYAKPLNMRHMRYSGIIRNALRVSKHVTESIRNIARGVGIN